ncbi:MAG TPA: hypothetical protein VF042_01925 [Gemmatimonadaceae bacterium]
MIRRSIAAVAFALIPGVSGAQEMITRIFEKATDIAPFFQVSSISSDSNLDTRASAMLGYGAEILFALKDDAKAPFSVELALGFNYLSGFRSKNADIDLRGSMRTIPELSVYATYQKTGLIEPYVGVHTGLLDLWHVQSYDTEGRQYKIDSESFQAGVTSGIVIHGIWMEGSYRFRNFPSLDYTAPEGVDVLPAAFPRSIDLSGWTLRAGYQFSIASSKDKN